MPYRTSEGQARKTIRKVFLRSKAPSWWQVAFDARAGSSWHKTAGVGTPGTSPGPLVENTGPESPSVPPSVEREDLGWLVCQVPTRGLGWGHRPGTDLGGLHLHNGPLVWPGLVWSAGDSD